MPEKRKPMRKDIKMLCVTNWGAVLELKTKPYCWVSEYKDRGRKKLTLKCFAGFLTVADPDAIDAGMIIRLDEIKLVARKKR